MKWVVDTCVILDVLDCHPEFADSSARALDAMRSDGLVVAPITFVELAPAFNGDVTAQNGFLNSLGIQFDFACDINVVLAAHRAWYEHILRKRTGAAQKRPIADVLIGAYALAKGGLITRNENDFRSLYPGLRIYNPTKASD